MAPSDTSAEPVMAADTTEPPVDAKPVHPLAEYIELGKTIAYALFIALVLRIVLFQPYTIPSASMEPTLREGDYIIVSKYAYGWSKHSIPFSPPLFKGRIFAHQPRRGDIVVFKLPNDNKTDFIKRLIALPGDTIQVKHGTVWINGKATPEAALVPEVSETAFEAPRELARYQQDLGYKKFTTYSLSRDTDVENTGAFTVPQGCYFMMGDNRDNSLDSRFLSGASSCQSASAQPFLNAEQPGVGFVPAENLVGKAEIILFSWKHGASLFKPWTWFLNVELGRFFHPLT
jgi:signal peptidase I